MPKTELTEKQRHAKGLEQLKAKYLYIYGDDARLVTPNTYNEMPVEETSPVFTVDNILPEDTLHRLISDLDRPSTFVKSPSNSYDFLTFYKFRDGSMDFGNPIPVEFDRDSNLISAMSEINFYSESIKEAVTSGLRIFGRKYTLVGKHSFHTNIIGYGFSNKLEIGEGPKHNDAFSENSMVLMLTDPSNPDKGWSGGHLKVSTSPDAFFGPSSREPVEMKYAQNRAIFFNNFGTVHQYTNMKGHTQNSKRIILSFFQVESRSTYTDIRNQTSEEYTRLAEAESSCITPI